MNDFKETLEYIEEVRNKEYVGIPFNLGEFDEVFPYIEPSRQILVFASTGLGKTQWCINRFLIEPFLFHLRTGYKLHITYAAIEMRKVDIMAQVMSHFYYLKHGDKRPKEDFLRKPDNALMQQLYRLEEDYYKFNEVVDITSEYKHPTGLYKYLKSKALANGRVIKTEEYKSIYINDTGIHQIGIIDTINSMKVEANQTRTSNIDLFSGTYSKELVDFYGFTDIILQQADKDSESNSFNFKGNRIEYKTMPSRGNLAYSKHTPDDANIVMSLYSPYAYSIKSYPFEAENKTMQYDITKWENSFRRLEISKNRDGLAPAECALYFDGKIADFKQLPKPQEFHKNPKLYDKYLK